MLLSISTALLAFAATISAYTQPVGPEPIGNPIFTPTLAEQVPVGQPFEITWKPTTEGTVTLLLLRGPSNNVKPLYPIVEKIPNSGKYTWTPKTDLENDDLRYGIQLIVDATGQYQYSVQFGIKNPGHGASSSSATSNGVPSTVAPVSPSSTHNVPSTSVEPSSSVMPPPTSVVEPTNYPVPTENPEPSTHSTKVPEPTYPVSTTPISTTMKTTVIPPAPTTYAPPTAPTSTKPATPVSTSPVATLPPATNSGTGLKATMALVFGMAGLMVVLV